MEWTKKVSNVWVWYYTYPYNNNKLPIGTMWIMHEDFKFFQKISVKGFMTEHDTGVWDHQHPADMCAWILMKLKWNPQLNLETLKEDFCRHYYGAAASHMQEYINSLEDATKKAKLDIVFVPPDTSYRHLTGAFLKNAQDIFNRAENAVRTDSLSLQRVRWTRMGVDRACLVLWEKVSPSFSPDKKKEIGTRYYTVYSDMIPQRLKKKDMAVWQSALDGFKVNYITPPAVPDEFKGKTVRQVTASDKAKFIYGKGTARTEDHEALDKTTISCELPDAFPIEMGVFNGTANKRMFSQTDITSGGYQLYKLATVLLKPKSYAYLTWFLWAYCDEPYDPDYPDQKWDVYASLRFEGPDFPQAKKGATVNKLFLDRVILVKGEETAPRPKRKKTGEKECILYYDFNESSAAVKDQSGNENDAAVNGAVTRIKLNNGTVLEFNGTAGHVSAPLMIEPDQQNITYSFWIKNKIPVLEIEKNKFLPVFSFAKGGDYAIFFNSGLFLINFHGDSMQHFVRFQAEEVIFPDRWYHIAASLDADKGSIDLYINGEKKGTFSGKPWRQDGQEELCIGKFERSHYNGLIGEFKIFNYSLSENEVKKEYETARDMFSE